jgi:acyl phosphate:glycerol-3-phosphate acyltransferase
MQEFLGEHSIGFILVLFTAFYLLGSANTARILESITKNMGILDTGTGNAGANNATRVFWQRHGAAYGALVGLVVLLIDMAKGFFIVYVARDLLEFGQTATIACAIMGMAGHNWPFLGLIRGGKGIAIFGGALLALHPLSWLVIVPFALALPFIYRLSGTVPFVAIIVFVGANYAFNMLGLGIEDKGALSSPAIMLLFANLVLIYLRRVDAEWPILKEQPSKFMALWYLLIYDRATNDPPPLLNKSK